MSLTQPISVTIATRSQRESMLQPEVEIVPRSAGKPGVELVIEPDLVVPFEGFLHRRHQDVLAVLHRQSSAYRDADNIAWEGLR